MALALRLGVFLVTVSLFSGCSTVSIPVLRHETGELLGVGRYRLAGKLETSRIFALLPAGAESAGITQKPDVFQGSLFGLQASAGVLPALDLQAGGSLFQHGAGWRLGAKVALLRLGPLAVAGMVGHGAYASSGTVNYLTAGQPIEQEQTFSVSTWDYSFPVSIRAAPSVVVYSGLIYLHSAISGSSGGAVVEGDANDVGFNLGLRYSWGNYEVDLEGALLRVYDPFVDGYAGVPFLGASFGITF